MNKSDRGEMASPWEGITRHRFLSPHYDDIPLSCGGTVARIAASGVQPEIVVIFGSEPDPTSALSAFADAHHQQWGLNAAEVIASRQGEEAAAARILGGTPHTLPFQDAIYRGHAYTSNEQLFGETTPGENDLPAAIVRSLDLGDTPDPQLRLYAPLGVGCHVDHQHATRAALRLARTGWDVWFYEDLPYALVAGALPRRLDVLTAEVSLKLAATVDVAATWDTKISAILAYRSQIAPVFALAGLHQPTPAAIDEVMRRYAVGRGGTTLAEVFWQISPPASGQRSG